MDQFLLILFFHLLSNQFCWNDIVSFLKTICSTSWLYLTFYFGVKFY